MAALLAAFAAWPAVDFFRPAQEVRVAAVLPALQAEATADPAAPTRRSVQAAGWLEPSPWPVVVSALADGVVEAVEVIEGGSVEEGQVIARLVRDDADLTARRAAAASAGARAELAAAEARLRAAMTRWEAATEVTRAAAVGAAERAMAASAVAAHPARIREAEANLARWREELELRTAALERGAASQREVSIAREESAARTAEVEALNAETAGVAARLDRAAAELAAANQDRELRTADRLALDAATAGVAAAEAAVRVAEAAEAEAQLTVERMTIRSPMSGLVLRRIKAPGDKVRLGMDDPHSAHLVHLYDPARLQARVDVPLADAAQVAVGQRCGVVVDVLPDEVFEGSVLRVTHEADLQKNTLEVQVRVIDPSPLLKPEMLARVRFRRDAAAMEAPAQSAGPVATSSVRVPDACLDGARVWAIRDRDGGRGSAVPVSVKVGSRADGLATVFGALRVGDLLVVDPADRGLESGKTVTVRGLDGAAGPATGGEA